MFGCWSGAGAQSVQFSGTQSVLGIGLDYPYGVAVDLAGNVYIGDSVNNRVLKVPPSDPTCSAGYCTTVGAGLNQPTGVAVDAVGNVYIADALNSRVLRVPSTDLTCATASDCTNVGTGLYWPFGVTLDANGNVYIASYGNSKMFKVSASDLTCATPGDCTEIAKGLLNSPYASAIDGSGNIYIADSNNNRVLRVPASDLSCSTPGDCTNVGPSNLSNPAGVVFDSSGNLYIADETTNLVTMVPPTDLTCSTKGDCTTVGTGLNQPIGLAVDAVGNFYISDSGNFRVVELQLYSVNVGAVNVGGSIASTTLNFTLNSADVTAIQYLTSGSPNLDFQQSATVGSCSTGASQTTTCTVNVSFTPVAPGQRVGAVVFLNGSTALNTTYLYGTGIGPQILFPNSQKQTVLNSSVYGGVVLNGAGDLFVISNNSLIELTAASGYTQANTLISGLSNPYPPAIDGAGNIFIGDNYHRAVKEVLAAGGYTTVKTIASGAIGPLNVAVDRNGNVFWNDTYNNEVRETLAAGGYKTTRTLFTTGDYNGGPYLQGIQGIAVDAVGNVFVADNNVVEELPVETGYTTLVPLLNTTYANQLALDAAGDIFVLQQGGLFELPAATGWSQAIPLPSTAVQSQFAFDAQGNIYCIGTGGTMLKLDLVDPPALTFASTATGTTSTDSPQTVIVSSSGNAPLVLSAPVSGTNPEMVGPYLLDASSNCPQATPGAGTAQLDSGTVCQEAINFEPTVPEATNPGSLTFTDNNLNATSATQAINLSGASTGSGVVQPILNWPAPSPIVYGTSLSGVLNAVAMNGANTVPGTYVYTSGGLTITSATILNAGTYTLNVAFTPTDTTAYEPATGSVPLVVGMATPGIALASSANPVLVTNPITLTATVSSAASTPTGSVTFLSGSTALGTAVNLNSSGVATLAISTLPIGTSQITAAYSGDSNFNPNTSAAVAESVEDFNLQISASGGSVTSVTVAPGATATFQLVVGPVAPATTFPAAVSLSVTGLPPGATADFSPLTLPAGSGTTTVTLTVGTSATAAAQRGDPQYRHLARGFAPLTLALVLLPLTRRVRRARKRFMRLMTVLLVLGAGVAAVAGLSGCGSTTTGYFGQAPHSYTITATGTSGALSHSTTVTLTVE